MRKTTGRSIFTAAAIILAFSLSGCAGSKRPGMTENAEDKTGTESTASAERTVEITSLNGKKEKVQLEVPFDPQRIAVLDMASLDILDSLGFGDRVVGTADTSIDYLARYAEDPDIENLGTIKEADLEAVMASEPDVIFIGGRLASSYDALSEIAPVIYLSIDTETGVAESVRNNTEAVASLFGAEEKAAAFFREFDARLEKLADFAEGKTAVVGMATSGSFNVLGDDGRCSVIGREIGFQNLGNSDTASSHGNETSFELISDLDPDYLFVLDRDSAIGREGAKLARDIVENQLIKGTEVYKNGRIVYLASPEVWYTAEGGIQAFDRMLKDLEESLL